MILVDTSVWVRHLREGYSAFAKLLEEGEVCLHPMIIGELACGNLSGRKSILGHLNALPKVTSADYDEVLAFIELHKLMGKGLGYIDAHLLASAVLSSVRIWTEDKNLQKAAASVKVAYEVS